MDSPEQEMPEQVVLPEPEQYLEDYTPMLPNDHPCRDILLPLYAKLNGIFELGVGKERKVPNNKVSLEVFCRECQQTNTNHFVYKFVLPGVGWEAYSKLATDSKLQLQLDPNLATYDIEKQISDDCKAIYMAYRKVLFISGRDFFFIRHQFESTDGHWVIVSSLKDREEYHDRVRGQIKMCASRFVEREDGLHASVYSNVDMKLKMKPSATKPKAILEIKKMLEREYAQLKQQ